MTKKTMRIIIDAFLSVMIVAEMFIQYTGVFWHEIIGFVLFATVITHLALQARWMKGTARMAKTGKMTGRATVLSIVGTLLALTMILLGISSVAISTVLASAGFTWAFGNMALWSRIHAVTSYALCALVVVHLSLHWVFLATSFKVPYNPERRRAIGTGVHAMAALGAVALGIAAVDKAIPVTVTQGTTDSNAASDASSATAPSSSTASATTSSTASNSASDQSSRSGRGHGQRGRSASDSNVERANASSAPASSSAPTSNGTNSSTSNAPSSSTSASSTSATTSGICTLCHKRCPLSAPQCDRPYREGLL